jgi:hypothetical protein
MVDGGDQLCECTSVPLNCTRQEGSDGVFPGVYVFSHEGMEARWMWKGSGGELILVALVLFWSLLT